MEGQFNYVEAISAIFGLPIWTAEFTEYSPDDYLKQLVRSEQSRNTSDFVNGLKEGGIIWIPRTGSINQNVLYEAIRPILLDDNYELKFIAIRNPLTLICGEYVPGEAKGRTSAGNGIFDPGVIDRFGVRDLSK